MFFNNKKANESLFGAIGHTDISWKGIQITAFVQANDTWWPRPPLATWSHWGSGWYYDLISQAEKHRAYFRGTLNLLFLTNTTLSTDRHPMATPPMRWEMWFPFGQISELVLPTLLTTGNSALFQAWRILETNLFQGHDPFIGDMVVIPSPLINKPSILSTRNKLPPRSIPEDFQQEHINIAQAHVSEFKKHSYTTQREISLK